MPESRRDFLGHLRPAGGRPRPRDSADSPAPGLLMEVGRPAMGCRFEVLFPAGAGESGTEAACDALDRVEFLERQLTLYDPASDLCRVNRSAAERPVRLEEALWHLVEYAAALHRATRGAFDITTTPLSRLWGFHRREGRLPPPDEIEQTLERVGMQHVELDPAARTMHFRHPGIELSFASLGKGYALDEAASLLADSGIEDFVIHGGFSSILARGTQHSASRSEDEEGWRVAVRDPYRPERRLGRIVLRHRALATSGIANQSFIHQGKRYGHLLDPRTGYPAEGLASVTVVAPSALAADALSTALFVSGREDALAFLDAHPEVGAILVSPSPHEPIVEAVGLGATWLPESE